MRERRKKELVFFGKLTLLKSNLNSCFLLLSVLESLRHSNLDTNFLGGGGGGIVTSKAVLDHLVRDFRAYMSFPFIPCGQLLKCFSAFYSIKNFVSDFVSFIQLITHLDKLTYH